MAPTSGYTSASNPTRRRHSITNQTSRGPLPPQRQPVSPQMGTFGTFTPYDLTLPGTFIGNAPRTTDKSCNSCRARKGDAPLQPTARCTPTHYFVTQFAVIARGRAVAGAADGAKTVPTPRMQIFEPDSPDSQVEIQKARIQALESQLASLELRLRSSAEGSEILSDNSSSPHPPAQISSVHDFALTFMATVSEPFRAAAHGGTSPEIENFTNFLSSNTSWSFDPPVPPHHLGITLITLLLDGKLD
ncbi:hypothetical protein P7C70_g2356, partial [Phenoliferia sp. Uapishka_3]